MKRELLKSLRGSNTQKYIAEKLGITQQYVSDIENGRRTPNVRLMKKMEDYFGVPMERLFPDVFNKTESTA